MKPALPIFHVQLLPTADADIDEDLRTKVVRTCSPLASVHAVYACRLRQESLDGEVSERISIAIEPLEPKGHGPNPLPAPDMRKLFKALAPEPGDSLGFPSGRSIEPWKDLGACLYERPSSSRSGGGLRLP